MKFLWIVIGLSLVVYMFSGPREKPGYDYAARQHEESMRSLTDDIHRLTDRAVR
jgi:hypothetical protein